MEKTTILAIETSCDETGVAIASLKSKEQNTAGKDNALPTAGDFSNSEIQILASALASQVDIHKETGGVVPNVAAREHKKVIQPLVEKVMREAGMDSEDITTIAVTVGPGLAPALWVGVNKAKELAEAWNIPIVPVHHIEGHIISALLRNTEESAISQPSLKSYGRHSNFQFPEQIFPALALIVSGGHTMFIEVQNWLQYRVIGQTRDDAAGEAFDKVARLLGLPYPGGPEISKLAEEGDPSAIQFPRPMIHSGDLDVSFSGLKTAVLYELRDNPQSKKEDIAASFQAAAIDSLAAKTNQALEGKTYQTLLLAGGVAANTSLRSAMEELSKKHRIKLHTAPLQLCGDNAVMIGQVGLLAHTEGRQKGWQQVEAHARIPLEEFSLSTSRSG